MILGIALGVGDVVLPSGPAECSPKVPGKRSPILDVLVIPHVNQKAGELKVRCSSDFIGPVNGKVADVTNLILCTHVGHLEV